MQHFVKLNDQYLMYGNLLLELFQNIVDFQGCERHFAACIFPKHTLCKAILTKTPFYIKRVNLRHILGFTWYCCLSNIFLFESVKRRKAINFSLMSCLYLATIIIFGEKRILFKMKRMSLWKQAPSCFCIAFFSLCQ